MINGVLRATKQRYGFALPTVLVASITLLIILLASASGLGSIRTGLNSQYYAQLAREAAESGVAMATSCLRNNNYNPTWESNSVAANQRLTPNRDCNGNPVSGQSSYVLERGNIRTTFVVDRTEREAGGTISVQSTGKTELLRSSNKAVRATYTQNMMNRTGYKDRPQISGGAGWKDSGHISAYLSTSGQLYGFGANNASQLNDSSTPPIISNPTALSLPPFATRISKVVTSGQGASVLCVIDSNGGAWCRGSGMGLSGNNWQQVNLGNKTAKSIILDGYGSDGGCIIASDDQAWCFGKNDFGMLGTGPTSGFYPITNPQRFPIPSGKAVKVAMHDTQTCVITDGGDAYCAGLNNGGQVTGTVDYQNTPLKYNLPGNRKVKDILMQYHGNSEVVHVLATDGTYWNSGWGGNGELANGDNQTTGRSQTPTRFTTPNSNYASGSIFWNGPSGRCVDNSSGSSANGNKIQLWDCSNPDYSNSAQAWIYMKGQISNIGTGKCMDIPGGNAKPGAVVQLYDCNNSTAQMFDLVDGIGGKFIKQRSSGLCVDAAGGGTTNGTQVQLWTCNYGNPQTFTRWPAIMGWEAIVAGNNFNCAIRTDLWSGMWCAGKNDYGQLANYATAQGSFMNQCQSTPAGGYNYFNVNLPGGAKVDSTKLSSEWQYQYLSLMVIATDGNVYGSGRNEFGKLGNGTLGDSANDYRSCATTKFQLPNGVKAVDMSTRDEYTTYVLGDDGRVYAAGRNNNGQVGDGTTTDRLVPVEVQVPRSSVSF